MTISFAPDPMPDLPAITIAAGFLPPTLTDSFDLMQVSAGVFLWDNGDAVLLERLQTLAMSVAQVQIEQEHTDTWDFLLALQGRVDLEIDLSFEAEIPDAAWHFCLMAAHNALLGATTEVPVSASEEPHGSNPLPLVSLRGELIQAAAKGTFAQGLVKAGVFICDEVLPDRMPNLQQAAEAVAGQLALNEIVHAEDFVRELQRRIDVDITACMETDPPGIDALVFLMAAHNALNSLLAYALIPMPFKADDWAGPQADDPVSPGDDTVALYPRGDEPVLLTADEQQAGALVGKALEVMASFFGALELPLRERLSTLYATPRLSTQGLARIVDDTKLQLNAALTALAGYTVEVDSLEIHTARTGKTAVSGRLWAWLSHGTPRSLAPPQLNRDAYDFVMNSWTTLNGAPFTKADGSTVTVNEIVRIGRDLDIGQVIADKCEQWAREDDVAEGIAQEAQANFEITLLNALKSDRISTGQYGQLLASAGVSVPGYTDGNPMPYGNQHLRIEAHELPVFGLRTRKANYIYAATEPEGRLFIADLDKNISAVDVFMEAFRGDLWLTRQRRDGWSWSLLGPAAQQAVMAKLPQPLPDQPAKNRPATAHWTAQGVYASKADYDRKASEVNLTVPYAIRQSTAIHALEVARPTWRPPFISMLAHSRRAFIASQVKEHFTPNQQSSLTHALRIGSEYVSFVLDVLLIAVPGKVKFPGRALLFKAMLLKQLAIDLPTSVVKSKWDEAGEALVDFFETVLEMGATRKAGTLARSRLDKLNRALLPDRHGDTGHSTDIPLTEPALMLRGMLPPALQVLKDADLSEILRQSAVSAAELSAMRTAQAPMRMELAVEASLAMNRVLRAQATLTLGTPRYRELPSTVEWPIVGLLSQHLDICITVQGPDGMSLRRFEPASGSLMPGSAAGKPEMVLTRYGNWHFSEGSENRNGAISNSLFYYVQPAPAGARPGDRVAQTDRLRETVAELLLVPEIEHAFARAIHHGARPRASVQATDGMLLAVSVEGKDTVDPGRLTGGATRWISAESERRVPDANSIENFNKARLQHDLALLNGGFGLSASPALTQSAESLYLSGLLDLFNGTPGMDVAVRVVTAGRSVAVWGNEGASQVLVLERRGVVDAHDYLGRLDARDSVSPAAQSANPLSELLLRLMSDTARDTLAINITEPHVLTRRVMDRVLSVRALSPTQGGLRGFDVTPQAGLATYVQTVTLTVSPEADGLARHEAKVWLEWGHGALEVRAEGEAWRVLSAAGGAGPLMLRSYGEWRILQEPIATLETLGGASVQDAPLLAKLNQMQIREPSARVYHVWADDSVEGGSYIAFRGSNAAYYRVRTAEAGAAELEVVRADGSGGGVWVRQGPSGVWEAARTLLGGMPDEEQVVLWRPQGALAPRPIPTGFGLQDSNYAARFRIGAGSHKAQNRFYPFVCPRGQQDVYNSRLSNSDAILSHRSSTANIATKVEVFSNQWGMPLDITSLPFFDMPGKISTEVRLVNGALIADLIGKRVAGQPVVRRILEPMAGSGFYSNYARAVGFTGAMQVNDVNPLVYLTQREIVEQPDQVKHYIESIKANLAALAYEGTGMRFDSIDLKKQFATRAEAEVFMTSEAASRIREDMKNYFYRLIDTHFVMTPAGIGVRSTLPENEARAFLAAAFYLMQYNSARHAAVRINSLGRIDLPMSSVVRDRQFVSLLYNGIANIDHLNYLSHLHTAQGESSVFTNYNGWEMFDPIDGTTKDGDLAIVSGHFSDNYLTEAQFMEKVTNHVVPFVNQGGRVVIINTHSLYKAEAFSELGFQVFEIRTPSTGYLLAVNTQVVTDVGLAVN
ncbi:hypothetical protein DM813_22380 [Pseudomonas alkylphenolica]|uniref:Uncharacterized protein n=1 Tax=Pseudomonas alkylphenolica TaxID=237609 RepID=A0A443ZJT0_9PSED|nr:hypothetical protein [Pseudomonas alkylphenolica]RWU19067.1 hypothetical protein DM813_22380 [Pseudomonas alkylphenolica]